MPTFKYGDVSALTLSEKITTPTIHIQKDGDNWYVPLFVGDKDSVVRNGGYNYTLGGFKVGAYRVAIGREEAVIVDIYVFSSNETTWILTSMGDLYGCGNNNLGQQGSSNKENVLTFTKRAENVKQVSCSTYTTWYVNNNGDLYGCGQGKSGQQGSGSTSNVSTFTKRASNVKEVSCSAYTTWYIDNDNNLYGCGYNNYGQQGSNDTNNVKTFTKREL